MKTGPGPGYGTRSRQHGPDGLGRLSHRITTQGPAGRGINEK